MWAAAHRNTSFDSPRRTAKLVTMFRRAREIRSEEFEAVTSLRSVALVTQSTACCLETRSGRFCGYNSDSRRIDNCPSIIFMPCHLQQYERYSRCPVIMDTDPFRHDSSDRYVACPHNEFCMGQTTVSPIHCHNYIYNLFKSDLVLLLDVDF